LEAITDATIRALFAQEVDEMTLLATISGPGIATIHLTTCAKPLPGGAAVGRGLVSSGVTYRFYPFRFTGGGSAEGQPSRGAKLEVAGADGAVIAAAKTSTPNTQPKLDLKLVRVAAPDTIETAITGAKIIGVQADFTTAVANLIPRDFAGEPACQARYVAGRTPALY
jgi:hypothetical protein